MCKDWHSLQSFTHCSMSLSMPGHHKYARASAFIRTIPGCVSCSISSACFLPFPGTTTLFPHNTHPPSELSSFFLLKYGWMPGSSSVDPLSSHPSCTHVLILDRVVSWSVQSLMCLRRAAWTPDVPPDVLAQEISGLPLMMI